MKISFNFAVFVSVIVGAFSSPLSNLASSLLGGTPPAVTPEVSASERNNPFLRHKRDVNCPIPQYLPQLVQELNTFLPNASVFIGLPQQLDAPTIPANQPKPGECPLETGSWWPGASENLKSTCPWVYVTRDLGASTYPRYILDVECVCPTCIGNNVRGCKKLRTDVTVFERGACRDGLAVMTARKERTSSGCYCAGTSTPTPAPPID